MSFFSAEGGPIWIQFRRHVDCGDVVEIETRCRVPIWRSLGEFNGMSSRSHVSHCRVLPLGKFTVMIPAPHATLQGAVTWRTPYHDRATLQGVRIPFSILKTVFRNILFFCFLNAVWALTSGGFRIVSDTLVKIKITKMMTKTNYVHKSVAYAPSNFFDNFQDGTRPPS